MGWIRGSLMRAVFTRVKVAILGLKVNVYGMKGKLILKKSFPYCILYRTYAILIIARVVR